jgi:hypothetical protein
VDDIYAIAVLAKSDEAPVAEQPPNRATGYDRRENDKPGECGIETERTVKCCVAC